MISDDQIKKICLKANIITNILENKSLNIQPIIEFVELEFGGNIIHKLDGFFNFAVSVLEDNQIKVINNADFENVFRVLCGEEYEDKEHYITFYTQFLKLLVEDDLNDQISNRLERLLALNCEKVPSQSEARKLYLYTALSLAISNVPLDLNLIQKLNTELDKYTNY